MSYLVLARKYRPQTFDALVGQEHIARTLRNAIASGRIAHAFLFTGIRGVGKTSAARLLAKALNCAEGPTATPCNACVNCKEISASASMDVLEIDGASNRGIDNIRDLNEAVRYRPSNSRFRIYILDEAHMVTKDAFNALLKTLEEPPSHVKFIFATTEPDKFPDTILSRCQRYDFRRIPPERIVAQLTEIAEREEIGIPEPALYLIAREAEGSMRDAESILDRLIAFAGSEISEEDVSDILGVADRKTLLDLSAAVLEGDAQGALAVVDRLHESGRDLERFAQDLVTHFRDLAMAGLTDGPGREALLAGLAEDTRSSLVEQASRRSTDDLHRMFRILLRSEWEVRSAPSPRPVLEMAVLRLATLDPAVPVAELRERLAALESGGSTASGSGSGGAEARTKPAAPARRAAPAPESAGRAAAPTANDGAAAVPGGDGALSWNGFLAHVQGEKLSLALTLRQARMLAHDGGRLVVGTKGRFHRELSNSATLGLLCDYASSYYGEPTDVRIEVASEDSASPRDPTPQEKAQQNDAVQRAREILGAEIREVRPARSRSQEESP